MQVIKYVFQPHCDDMGQLVALEELKNIPFLPSESARCIILRRE